MENQTETETTSLPTKPSEPQTFPERLKMLREERGLTQTKLCRMLGCSFGAVMYWEDGRRFPKGTWLRNIAAFFSVTPSYLRDGGKRINTTNVVKALKQTTTLTNKAFLHDEAISTAVSIAAESKFLRGLQRLGLSQDQVDLVMSSKEFKNDNMLDTVAAVGGMIDRQLIYLMTEVTKLNELIADPNTTDEKRKSLINDRSKLHFDIVQFARINQSGLMLSAKVQQIWAELNENKKGDGKPKPYLDLNG